MPATAALSERSSKINPDGIMAAADGDLIELKKIIDELEIQGAPRVSVPEQNFGDIFKDKLFIFRFLMVAIQISLADVTR